MAREPARNTSAHAPTEPRVRLEQSQIEALIPHRGGILFVREAWIAGDDHFGASVRWTKESPGLNDHFPGHPIVPAVYMIEAAAQLAGIGIRYVQSAKAGSARHSLGVLAAVQRATFARVLYPDEPVTIDATVRSAGATLARVTAQLQREGELVARVELMLASLDSGHDSAADAPAPARVPVAGKA